MFDSFFWEITIISMCLGALVLATHVKLGTQVISRGIVFIDLAIAQIAGLGVLISQQHFVEETFGDSAQLLAYGFALLGAGLIAKLAKRSASEREAVIGTVYVCASALGVLLISSNPHGAEQFKSILNGQILWVQWHDMLPLAVYSLGFAVALKYKPRLLESDAFYYIFALLITASVQLVGIYLVFACLVFPVITFRHASKQWLKGVTMGLVAFLAAVDLSYHWDLPTGAAIVVTMAAFMVSIRLIISLLGKKRGH
ncbi:metal ABC transporter permease [Paraferrimonas sp. SM1919]|uniref:metal ABC transporter permease n=1 Tax=Paraferrimonas sp. SM1919 TaxID=2662263 RepID=UPI0013D85D0B|nr:metal ABC transporter permease [Paraferrimonas sp. SM1919]